MQDKSIKKEHERRFCIPVTIQCFENFNGVAIHTPCKKANPAAKNVTTSGVQAKYLGQQMAVKLLLKNGTSSGQGLSLTSVGLS